MQSKTLVWAYLLILSLGTILSLYMPKNEAIAKESVVIPGDAIRLRILANSDTPSDQQLKRDVRDAVNAKITLWVKDLTSLDKAKAVIHEKLPEIQAIAEKVVKDHGSTQSVKVQFGKVQFPTKLYGEFLYPAGEYKAILITLGKGEGANWWCVLYPPLCFLDFSNGVAVSSDGFTDQKPNTEAKATADSDDAEVNPKELAINNDTEPKKEKEPKREAVLNTGTDEPKQNASVSTNEIQPKEDSSVSTVDHESNQEVSVSTDDIQPNVSSVEDELDQQVPVSTDDIQQKQAAPVYTPQDEQPVQVKFFIVELWKKIFG